MSQFIEQRRKRIDELDSQILRLLNQRAEYALQIGREKHQRGQFPHSPEREAEILKRLVSSNRGPLDGQSIQRIFQTILDESRRLQERQISAEGGA
jgi:chorismate mutase-like protein